MARKFAAELLGTALLVFFAVGVATLSFGFKADGSSFVAGVVATALAFGLTLLALAYVLGPISGCHVNPAVTLGVLVAGRISLRDAVSRLESEGGVHRFEELVDAQHLARVHDEYAERRRQSLVRRDLTQPQGGVGGTRIGVKCLHAHLANYLVGYDDPVGELVASTLDVPPLVRENVRD